ncbi:MFS transporter [Rhodococcus sp. NCIMB 12038]|uniref:MFS transporter n=1 Tax=Rhodococcus sp. NCIMB 12038 TaxID=933800 RepID=UPI0015C5D473|nr:MFS transporter [Rhodococcus sp. NCIMB 12038]
MRNSIRSSKAQKTNLSGLFPDQRIPMTTTRELVNSAPISRLQIRVLIVCLIANMAEGYDLLSISITVVPLADAWGLTGTQTGLLLAMGPVGMAVGALVLAPLSDRYGRRSQLIVSLVTITAFIGLSGAATDVTQLAVFRLLTGIGMGGLLPILTITIGEFAPLRRRAAAISFVSVGFPLGSAAGGAGAALLMASAGWQSAFVLGAVLTLIACLLVVAFVPETPDFLDTKNTPDVKQKRADLLTRMGIDPDEKTETLPSQPSGSSTSQDRAHDVGFAIRSSQMGAVALLFLVAITTQYFCSMWLPKLLVLAGMSPDGGSSGVLLLSLGAAASGLAIAALSTRFSLFTLITVFAMLSAVLLAVFSLLSSDLAFALVVAPILGLCQCATSVSVYALVPALFSADNRSAAMGLGIGISRIGMTLMPLGVGILIDMSWTPEAIFQLMIIPTLISVALAYYLWRSSRSAAVGRSWKAAAATSPASSDMSA